MATNNSKYSQNKIVRHNYREARKIRAKCKEQQAITKKKEKQRAQAMFAGGANGSANHNTNGKTNGNHVPAAENGSSNNNNNNHSDHGMNNSSNNKRVTFEDGGTPRDEYYGKSNNSDDSDGEDYGGEEEPGAMPWYLEHQELMILAGGLAVVGLGVSQLLSLTSGTRSGR